MITVADKDGGVEIHTAHDLADGEDGMDGGVALALDDDIFGWDPAADEVVAADLAFRKLRVTASAASSQHERGETFRVQGVRVVEAGAKNRRRAAVVFGSAEDDDNVGGMSFVDFGLLLDLAGDGVDDSSGHQANANEHEQ